LTPSTTGYRNVAKEFCVAGANLPIPETFLLQGGFTAPTDISGGVSFGRWEGGALIKNLNHNHTVIEQMAIEFLPEALYLRPRTIG
jgi:hypothetical protein